jgi:hypothetical protein
MHIHTIRVGLAGMIAAAGLAGGLLLSGALVSAQAPDATTPATQESTPPDATTTPGKSEKPRHGEGREKLRDGLCDKDGDGQPDGATGTSNRGHGPRAMVQ